MRFLLTLAAVLSFALPARATVLVDATLEERIAHADSVVVGTVGAQRVVVAGDGTYLTESTVSVARTLYGSPARSVVVTQIGGTIGDTTMDVPGQMLLRTGERVVLILKKDAQGRRFPVGMSLGVFYVSGARARQRIDEPLMRRDGTLRAPPGEVTVDLSRLAAVAQAVRSARGAP